MYPSVFIKYGAPPVPPGTRNKWVRELKEKADMAKNIVEVETLAPGPMKLQGEMGSTLELMMWKNEPCVLVDGRYIISHTTLSQSLVRAGYQEEEEVSEEDKAACKEVAAAISRGELTVGLPEGIGNE